MTIAKHHRRVEESRQFYRRYIRQAVDHYTNAKLCLKIGVSESFIINVMNRDNFMALKRLAELIENKIGK